MIAPLLANLPQCALCKLRFDLASPTVRNGPPRLVAWWAALGRCVDAELLIRAGVATAPRDEAERAYHQAARDLTEFERGAMLCSLRRQIRRMPRGPLRDLAEGQAHALTLADDAARAA